MLNKLTHIELINLIKEKCIPPLLPTFHKGQSGGRVCIIGGCEDYTGAPFFSANATALMGCDLTHVICEQNAATVIKSYSPNLMVHPYLLDGNNADFKTKLNINMDKIFNLLERIHVIVIGPGLGRDSNMLQSIKLIIKYILQKKNGQIPIVIDADGLYLVSMDKEVREMLQNFPTGKIILTPNVMEFKRLYNSIFNENKKNNSTANFNNDKNNENNNKMGYELAKKMNCIVIEKGNKDLIYSPVEGKLLVNEQIGSNKRVGGQGDTLTGTVACMLNFSRLMFDFNVMQNDNLKDETLNWVDYALLSCYAGSSVTRECARLAFESKGRAMQTTDLNERVGEVYAKLFD